jgi:DNA-binding NarL/FixJ family response regulator
VNDYEIIVRGLQAMLEPYGDRINVVELDVLTTPDHRVDVALFDTFAAHRDSIQRSMTMAEEGNAEHVVLYTWDASPAFLDAARSAGVAAVLRKSLTGAHLVDALTLIVQGRPVAQDELSGIISEDEQPLTMREREVLALLALGLSNAEIAAELYLSADTVKTHIRRLFKKLGVRNRTQAAMLAHDHQLAPPPSRLERLSAAGMVK